MNIQKFDTARLKEFVRRGGDPTSDTTPFDLETKRGDTIIRESAYSAKTENGYYREIIPPVPALFYSIESFDEKGRIKEKTEDAFLGDLSFDYGKKIFFDTDGNVTEIKDFSDDFSDVKIKLEDLLKILTVTRVQIQSYDKDSEYNISTLLLRNGEKITPQNILAAIKKEDDNFEEMIINPKNREDLRWVRISKDEHNNWWVTKKYMSGEIAFLFDGQTGKLLKSEYSLVVYDE